MASRRRGGPLRHLLLLALLAVAVDSQSSSVSCASLPLLSNTLSQTPCLVYAYLESAATATNYSVDSLQSLGWARYLGATQDAANWQENRLRCSLPYWNVVSACEACQGVGADGWAKWTANCGEEWTNSTDFPTLELPVPVPAGTELPEWAQLDFRQTGWDTQVAEQNASAGAASSSSSSLASSTTGSPPVSSSMSSTSATGGSTSSSLPTWTGTPKARGTPVGAIVGSVVGGLAVLGLIALGLVCMARRVGRDAPPKTEPAALPRAAPYRPVRGTPSTTHGTSEGHGRTPTTPSGRTPTTPSWRTPTTPAWRTPTTPSWRTDPRALPPEMQSATPAPPSVPPSRSHAV